MVHKLVSKGTIEEKIDAMIESKKELAENVVGSGGENWITEMSNEQLLSIFTLDEG
jgi:non-specific serine/threonine protein kinase